MTAEDPTIALCLLVHDRPDELRAALASAAGDGWAEVVVLDNASSVPVEPVPGVRWERSGTNLGVTGGRNRLAELASADVLVFLDDDAVFLHPVVDPVRQLFREDPRLGLVAFRIERSDGRIEPSEYPFRGPARDAGRSRPCSYFVGAGYAVRAEALRTVGGYDERFFYSTEEVDLGLRLMRAGYRLWYEASIVVEHRPAATGRAIAPDVPGMRLRNRVLLVRRHLPWPVGAVHLAAWTFRTLREARQARSSGRWWRAARAGWREPVQRDVVPWALLREAHRSGGRVLW